MGNLHTVGPFHYRQRSWSVSSPLNRSSGCVESGRVAFRYWQRSRSVSSLLDSSSGRAENGKVVRTAASTPCRPLKDPSFKVQRFGLTSRRAYPVGVGWTYRERLNREITCIILKVLQSYITPIVAAVLTKDVNCLGHEPAAATRNGAPSPGAGPPTSGFRRRG